MIKLVVLVACVGASLAAYSHNHGHDSHHHGNNHLGHSHGGHSHGGYNHGGHKGHGHDYSKPAHYGFEYGSVDPYTGAKFGHAEQRDGHVTKGSYFVQLPDGRTQKVAYTADKYGYHPIVTYEGHASSPGHYKGGSRHHKGHHNGGYH